MRIEDPAFVIFLRNPDATTFSFFILRLSGDPITGARGQAGVGIAPRTWTQYAFLDWVTINSLFCAVHLDGSVLVINSRVKRHRLFDVSVYVHTDCSSPETREEIHRKLSLLLHIVISAGAVVVASGSNAQTGYQPETGRHTLNRFSIPAGKTNKGIRLIQVDLDHRLFLSSTSFRHKGSHWFTSEM